MIKFFKWLSIIIVVLLFIGLLALLVFIRNFDVNKYKSEITATLSKSLEHPVQLKEIELDFSLEKGLNLNIKEFEILEKPPSSEKILSVDQALFGVDISAFVANREVLITRIEFDRPYIRVVQYPDETTNVQKLIDQQNIKAPSADAPKKKITVKDEIDLTKLKIRLIKIIDGRLIIENEKDERIEINDLNLSIENIELNKPFMFNTSLNIFSTKPNIFLKGEAQLTKNGKAVRLRDLQAKTSLSSFELEKLIKHVKALKELGIEEQLKGEAVFNIGELNASDAGLGPFDFEGRITDARVKLKSLRYPIENIDLQIIGKDPDVVLKEVFLYVGGGKISADGSIRQFMKDNAFEAELTFDEIRLEELIPQEKTDYKLVGRLVGGAQVKGEHNELLSYNQSMSGEAAIELIEGKILNLNVLEVVLDKLSFLPNIVENLNDRLPEHYKNKLNEKDTTISKCVVQTIIKEDNVFIRNITVEGDGFIVNARGRINLDQELFLEADFYMAADLATALLAHSDDVSFLLQDDGRLHIPFKPYRGQLDRIKMLPDIENISRHAIQSKGKQELRKAIFKALDLEKIEKKQGEVPAGAQEQDPIQSPPEEIRPEEILIENVLDAIFN